MKYTKKIGIVLIIFAILLQIGNYLLFFSKENIKREHVDYYLSETSNENEEKQISSKIINSDIYDYISVLEIPEISLKRGLVDFSSEYNNIAYNIAILNGSQMPDIINSNLILASHNGNSEVSFFKDLEKIKIGSLVNVYYKGYKYIYKIDNYYEVKKTGKINILTDSDRNAITLITCKNNSDTLQIVYIGYLITKETY